MRTTTSKPLTDHEEACADDAAYRLRATMRRLQRALVQRDREALLVETRRLKWLAEAIEQGLAE